MYIFLYTAIQLCVFELYERALFMKHPVCTYTFSVYGYIHRYYMFVLNQCFYYIGAEMFIILEREAEISRHAEKMEIAETIKKDIDYLVHVSKTGLGLQSQDPCSLQYI